MKKVKVFVVTDVELGWDNVVGVFSNKKAAEKCKKFQNNGETAHIIKIEIKDKFEDEDF